MIRFDPDGLREKRVRAGLSLRGLAKLCGISHQAIGAWETGVNVPKADQLPILADILDCGIRDLYTQPEVSPKAFASGDQHAATA